MVGRLISLFTWLLVGGSLAVIMGGLAGRPVLFAAVPSSSMVPVLNPGDLIAITPLLGRTLEPGQIIVFKTEKDESWIVHRIVGGNETEGFITRGDANRAEDPHRVFPRHVAGLVPQPGDRVMKLSRLGSFSLGGPLSNPYVAAVAMFLGIYLVASDQAVSWRQLRRRRHHRRKQGPAEVLGIYLSLGLAVSMLTYLSTWTLSSRQAGAVEVVAQRYTWSPKQQITIGEERQERVTLENPSRVPFIIGLSTDAPNLRWETEWVYLPPGGKQEVALSVTALELGRQRILLRQSVHLPFLPLSLLQKLGRLHWHAPAVAIALVPFLLMLVIAFTDQRLVASVRRLRLRLSLRAH